MSNLEAALAEAAEALERLLDPIHPDRRSGGGRVGRTAQHASPDLSVWADPEKLPDAVACLCRRLRSLTAQPLQFVERSRVLPLESRAGVRLDIVFGVLPIQREAILRAVVKPIAGRMIPVATVEDLVLMKLISERQKDLDHARALLGRFQKTLDREYLAPLLTELAEALSQPGILAIFRGEA